MPNIKNTVIVKNLSKSYGETKALEDCNFIARSNSINAVVGENGSGKSTLVKILSGILPPDKGEILILGETPKNPIDAKKIGLSTIFQEILLANDLSVVENIFMGHENIKAKKINNQIKIKKSKEILKRLSGIEFEVEKDAGLFPLNEKQWIVIARAILSNPKILIFDESSAALDLEATKKLHIEMRRLCNKGTTIIIISHRIKELVTIADYATILRDGKTVARLIKSEITEENLIHHLTRNRGKKNVDNNFLELNNHSDSKIPYIECSNLKLKNNSHPFSLEINKGSIMGVTGLDGQGQTDFIKILSGIKNSFSGNIYCFKTKDHKTKIQNLFDSEKNKIVYISGDRGKEGIFPNLSILENFGISIYKKNSNIFNMINYKSIHKSFLSFTKQLSLKFRTSEDLITSLSGGNQQKILIARALSNKPDTLILNDPARGVDIGTKNEIHNQLKIFASKGGTVIYLSTEIEEFYSFVDEVCIFYNHNLHNKLNKKTISEDNIMSSMFGQ